MTAALLVGTSSWLVGVAVGASAVFLHLRGRRCPDPAAHVLTDADREQVEREFASHVAAAHRAVSEFADALAGDDRILRARLRRFETQEGQS
ncbi:hypothetical protein AB4Z55_18220 [Gordonia sp. ABKF26]|uniref:hypothetical protein n=1 Tax=Gordonia sp. ABKF26 TaxID=3238687 RepID=UPI0034E50231